MPGARLVTRTSVCIQLLIVLTACGGSGGQSSVEPGPGPSKLFVGDAGHAAIGSVANSNPSPGPVVVDRIVVGPSTGLGPGLTDFALDAARDRLFVAIGGAIVVFEGISTLNGNTSSGRSFVGPGLGSYLYLDAANDILYAAINDTFTTSLIGVYGNISKTASSVFPLVPDRTISVPGFMTSMAVDGTKKILYTYSQAPPRQLSQISVFDNVDSLSGSVNPNRVISIGSSYSSGPPRGILLDSENDRLYASDFGIVLVFDNASAKDGTIGTTAAPERVITVSSIGFEFNLALDGKANRLYAVDQFGLNIIDNASTANGVVNKLIRVVAPAGSNWQAVAVKP